MNTILLLPPSYNDHGDMIVIVRGSILPSRGSDASACYLISASVYARCRLGVSTLLLIIFCSGFNGNIGILPSPRPPPAHPPSSHIPLSGRVLHCALACPETYAGDVNEGDKD